ncbi:MAG: hypothetical protein AAFR64_13800 [Pseudomonadota bacterium]
MTTLAAALFFCATPLVAQDKSDAEPEVQKVLDFGGMRPDDLVAEFESSNGRWYREPCTFGVPLLAALEEAWPERRSVRRVSLLAQSYCAADERRFEDGEDTIRELRELDADKSYPFVTLFIATQGKEAQLALDLLSWLDAESAKDVSPNRLWRAASMIANEGREAEMEDQSLAWFESGLIDSFDVKVRSGLAYRALSAAMRKDKNDAVPMLLEEITNPISYISLLTERKYEPIWPQIEERAGANLETVGELYVTAQRRKLSENEEDGQQLGSLVRALHYNGEFEAVIALVDEWLEREDANGKSRDGPIDEDLAWGMNLQAYAYDALGRVEEGDAVFDRLAQIDPEGKNWLVSFVINRSSRLVGFGRYEVGLEASRLARSQPGSTYAEMIVAKNHACALNALGRADEAEAELVFMRENKDASYSLLGLALLCHGLRDEAAAVLLEGLRDVSTRDAVIGDLQPPSTELFYTQSMLPMKSELLDEYPELAEEFAKHARILPEKFTPRAALLRAKLELPEWERP